MQYGSMVHPRAHDRAGSVLWATHSGIWRGRLVMVPFKLRGVSFLLSIDKGSVQRLMHLEQGEVWHDARAQGAVPLAGAPRNTRNACPGGGGAPSQCLFASERSVVRWWGVDRW